MIREIWSVHSGIVLMSEKIWHDRLQDSGFQFIQECLGKTQIQYILALFTIVLTLIQDPHYSILVLFTRDLNLDVRSNFYKTLNLLKS